jgi:hypothetical protein
MGYLLMAGPVGPICAEAGGSTMDPRLEHARGVRTRIRVKEPRPPLVAVREVRR